MKASEVRQLSREELLAELHSQREALFRLGVRRSTGEAAVASEFGRIRRDIARILTVLREQQVHRSPAAAEKGADQDDG